MADDFANAFATPPARSRARVMDRVKPGVWGSWPGEVPHVLQLANDLAVTHLVIKPLERLDRDLAKARARVDAVAAAAEALLFQPR